MVTTDTTSDVETVLADLELSRNLTIQMTAVGMLGLAVAIVGFSAIYQAGTGQTASFSYVAVGDSWLNDLLNLLILLVLGTVIIVPHEWLHGLAIRQYGGNPRYGVGIAHFILPYAYATSDDRFTRNQFLVILLVPLVGITLVGVPVMLIFEWGWLVFPLAANAAGAVSDVWMTLTLLGYPPYVAVEDHSEGVRIIGQESDRHRDMWITTVVWDAIAGAGVASVGLLAVVGLGGPVVLSVLGVESLTVGRPGTIMYLFSFTNTPTEFSFGVGPAVLVVGAGSGLAYSLVRAYST